MFKDYEQRTIQVNSASLPAVQHKQEFIDGHNKQFLSQVALVSWGNMKVPQCSSGGGVESVANSRDFHINLFKVVPFLKSILGNDTQDEYAPLHFLRS